MTVCKFSFPRYEMKFIANSIEYYRVLNWIRQHSSYFKTEYPDRQVNNIYFDTYNYNSYCENIYGSSLKSKVRFRWYGNSIEPKNGSLEIKCKRNQLNWKLIYKVQNDQHKYNGDWKEIWLKIRHGLPYEAKIWLETYPVPVLINRYKRQYFASHDNKIRVTLDNDLVIYDQTRKRKPNYYSKSNLPKVLILEIKFSKELKDHIVNLLTDIPLRASRFSKYVSGCISMNRL